MIGLIGIPVGTVSGAPKAWAPSALPGVALWLRGDDAANNGGNVDPWAARIGTNAIAGATKPTFGATLGGQPAVGFTNVNAIMTVAQALARPYWLIVVASAPNPAASKYVFDGTTNDRQSVFFQNDGTVRFYSTQFNAGRAYTAGAATLIVANLTTGAGNMDIAVNESTFTNQAGPGDDGGPASLTIGNYLGGGSGGVSAIAEVIAGAGAITAGDLVKLRAYALSRYGIA